MNKFDLITELARKEKITEIKATEIINLVFDCFIEEMKKDGRSEIRGFASFSVRKYKSYMGRNPKSGIQLQVKPKKLPFCKVGKELKKMVDEDLK